MDPPTAHRTPWVATSCVTVVASELRASDRHVISRPTVGDQRLSLGCMRFRTRAGSPERYMIPDVQVPMMAMLLAPFERLMAAIVLLEEPE